LGGNIEDDLKFNIQQLNQVEILTNLLRDKVKPRLFNHSSIDGEALFGVIESNKLFIYNITLIDFLENLNLEEVPIIKNALDNILLDRANDSIMKIMEDFKATVNEKFKRDNLPMDITEISAKFEELSYQYITKIAENLDETLRPVQISPLLIDSLKKMQYQISIIQDTNKKLQDEWFDEEYNNMLKNLKIKEVYFQTYNT